NQYGNYKQSNTDGTSAHASFISHSLLFLNLNLQPKYTNYVLNLLKFNKNDYNRSGNGFKQ
ncbi:hypothetical protein, partial [Kaistella sp.]|uniref:hypothetical protein n=1 Tax=Kaistella sp. TaxID=2782235 RepID=UPI0035A113DA